MKETTRRRKLLILIKKKRKQLNQAYQRKKNSTDYYQISLEMDHLIEEYMAELDTKEDLSSPTI